MKKKGIVILVGVCLLGVTGCGTEEKSTAEIVYENTHETFEQFANNEIAIEEVTNKLTEAYNEYCDNNDDRSCELLDSAISTSQRQPSELEDCSTYTNETAKNLCESTNKAAQYQNDTLDTTIRAQLDSIDKELSRRASDDSNE